MKFRWAYLLLGALLVGGLMISAFYSPIWYDDAGHFLVAREVARGHGMCYPLQADGQNCVPDSPFITMGPVLAYPLGAWLRLFGETMLAGRMLVVLLSLAAAMALFWLGKSLTSSWKALIAVGLMGLNIQFLTYGSEVLGEVPMIGLILAGMGFLLRWERGGPIWNAGLAILMWCLAVGIKEYAILPTGLSLGIWFMIRLISKEKPLQILALASTYAIALGLTLTLMHGGFAGLQDHLLARQSYGSEFLAFNLGISLKFLLFKPLFWLGTGAMVLKWRVKRRPEELLTLSVQVAWMLFFLLSAGYDRFGFLLLFLPAIYVAEFAPYLWQEAGRRMRFGGLRRVALVMIALAIFSQQTFWVFGKRVLHPQEVNGMEKAMTQKLTAFEENRIFTAEQQVALFLDGIGMPWRLPSIVPSAGRASHGPLPEFSLAPDELFLAGPYAFTEYLRCIDWTQLEAVDSLSVQDETWIIYRSKTPR